MNKAAMTERLQRAFPPEQAGLLAEVIHDAYDSLVKVSDFSELKAIMAELAAAQKQTDQRVAELAEVQRELAEAQKQTDQRLAELVEAQKQTDQRLAELVEAQKQTDQRLAELAEAQKQTDQRLAELAEAQKQTDQRLAELAEAQKQTDQRLAELAEAQKQTDQRLAELAEAQKRTDQRVAELAEAQKSTEEQLGELVKVVRGLAVELGGLSRAVSYSLENEAYRALPDLFRRRFGLEVEQRLIRTEVNGEEINLFGWARRDGQRVLIVGEAKLQLDMRQPERRDVLDQLDRKVEAVREVHPNVEIMPILVTHYARPAFIQEAEARGIYVFQSFEW